MEENPLWCRLGDGVTGQGVQLGHLLVRQHQVVTGPVNIPSNLQGTVLKKKIHVNMNMFYIYFFYFGG